ncbi:fumarate hydratase class II [Litorivivens lipolytica]|uniref:Fumarate hydratase class II n=1 Tax=Litorivivens lipolytica TaxID=1524264 RepID=A0A7W4W381_9GAMM|nr:class II fumarate hydratase [Litorivivens lipolytica]MBB3046064.1 fumarate hydratase class II [Litorivivens lipolytica]
MNEKTAFRIEKDSMGELQVPANALYAAQTQRAVNNFTVSGLRMPSTFIRGLLLAKAAAARANAELEQITQAMADAICQAIDQLLADENFMQHFPVDVFQTGSGTSSNMNANEVLATLASDILGQTVNPNDHVNCGQSSNDVIPSSIHISAAVELHSHLLPALRHLATTIRSKAKSVEHHVKTGRTHLMDAMPITMRQSLESWAAQITQAADRLERRQPDLLTLAQGGTAVGTGINAHPAFAEAFNRQLEKETGLAFRPAANFFTHIGSQDIAVALSGELKATAVAIMKIANDLRWMNSGPLAGLGEIELEALQPGSSIMPGKVNPVIPEAAAMVAAQVIGNDSAITVAGQSGNFELNVMLPLVAHNLLQSIELLTNASLLLADKAIATFKVNEERLEEALVRNPILVTALNPVIGYAKAAEIAKKAYKEGRAILDVAKEETSLSEEDLKAYLDPHELTKGGIAG